MPLDFLWTDKGSTKYVDSDLQPRFLWLVGLEISAIAVSDRFFHLCGGSMDEKGGRGWKEEKVDFVGDDRAQCGDIVFLQILQFLLGVFCGHVPLVWERLVDVDA